SAIAADAAAEPAAGAGWGALDEGPSRNTRASGAAASVIAAIAIIATTHPAAAIVPCAIGATIICPADPPAPRRPHARPRRSGDTRCTTRPMSSDAPPAAAAAALPSPIATIIPARLVADATATLPNAQSTA